jgi:hypothetical protein
MKGKKTGGRTRGARNKTTERDQEIREKAAAEGITPLEYLLNVMRTEYPPELKSAIESGKFDKKTSRALLTWHRMRYEAAKDAAPYIHPRLTATTVKGTGKDGEIPVGVKVEFV